MTTPGPGASKPEWRTWARTARREVDFPAVSTAVVDALATWPVLAAARTVLVFFPMGDEVDTTSLITRLADHRFVATRTPARGGSLTVHEVGGPLEVHRLGFVQPHRSAREVDPADVDLLLIPGLAFDLYGNRLGRGGGYFDELLTRVRTDASCVGVTPVSLVVDHLPHDEHDRPVRYLATEEGVIEVAPRPAMGR